jgi:hypothetical protein
VALTNPNLELEGFQKSDDHIGEYLLSDWSDKVLIVIFIIKVHVSVIMYHCLCAIRSRAYLCAAGRVSKFEYQEFVCCVSQPNDCWHSQCGSLVVDLIYVESLAYRQQDFSIIYSSDLTFNITSKQKLVDWRKKVCFGHGLLNYMTFTRALSCVQSQWFIHANYDR